MVVAPTDAIRLRVRADQVKIHRFLLEISVSGTIDQHWHHLLSERNALRGELDALRDAVQRYHDDHHLGPARWCDAPPCQLLAHRLGRLQPKNHTTQSGTDNRASWR